MAPRAESYLMERCACAPTPAEVEAEFDQARGTSVTSVRTPKRQANFTRWRLVSPLHDKHTLHENPSTTTAESRSQALPKPGWINASAKTRPGTGSVTSTRRLTSKLFSDHTANVALHLLSTPSSAVSNHAKPGKATDVFFYALTPFVQQDPKNATVLSGAPKH